MPNRIIPQIGTIYGRLTVIEYLGHKNGGAWAKFRCDCGEIREFPVAKIKFGHTVSCGCFRREVTGAKCRSHGKSKTPTYSTWCAMKARCHRKSSSGFPKYGGRGITVCERWKSSYANFLNDMGEKPTDMSLERKDNEGNYEKNNCKWATIHEQQRNKRSNVNITHKGVTLIAGDWDKKMGFNKGIVLQRIRNGWSSERAIETPIKIIGSAAWLHDISQI